MQQTCGLLPANGQYTASWLSEDAGRCNFIVWLFTYCELLLGVERRHNGLYDSRLMQPRTGVREFSL